VNDTESKPYKNKRLVYLSNAKLNQCLPRPTSHPMITLSGYICICTGVVGSRPLSKSLRNWCYLEEVPPRSHRAVPWTLQSTNPWCQ